MYNVLRKKTIVSSHMNAAYFAESPRMWRGGLHLWLVMWRSWVRTPIKGPRCFLEQETLPFLHSTGWFQERIRAWYHNRTQMVGLMEDWFKCQISPLVKYRQNQTKMFLSLRYYHKGELSVTCNEYYFAVTRWDYVIAIT